MSNDYRYSADPISLQSTAGSFIYKVYGWMTAALALTAAVAYLVSTQPSIMQVIFSHNLLLIGLAIAQIALVVTLSSMLTRLSYSAAIVMFMFYAALLGLTLSAIFLQYNVHTIVLAFAVTAGMFGVMAFFGLVTKADLTGVGSLCSMALVGLVIAMLANMYFKNPIMDYIVSGIGVVLFSVLTAVDMQKIKLLGAQMVAGDHMTRKVAIIGALTLYLDFINLFLMLLRLFGTRDRRD